MKVEEVQGLYGPFSLSERVLQRIWAQGEFYQQDLKTRSGKSLRILNPGRLNLHEGPDFLEARLLVDGTERIGDVEIHFRESDWFAHAHESNPNFRRVVLHVVLYDAPDDRNSDAGIELLALMPLLERDLESYAMDAALVDLEQAGPDEGLQELVDLPLAERERMLEEMARRRWEQKVRFARKRLEAMSWEACCHQFTLEVLGYSRNRATMNRVASRYSVADFAGGLSAEGVYEEFGGHWKLKGMRPVNHPRVRLKQYSKICGTRPDWPSQLRSVLESFPIGENLKGAAAFRKANRLKALQGAVSESVFSGILAEKRLNTLFCDGIFPLAEAAWILNAEQYWTHWYPGDMPASLIRACRFLRSQHEPLSNGDLQAVLQHLIVGQAN